MKKILIPIIGLLVLIFLTPVILGKMANSNIDKKIEIFKKDGIKIKELQKDMGYINSKRVFEVEFDKNTKKFNKYINKAKFLVTLTFKNLPITKANFDVEVKNINVLNQNILEGLKAHIVTKDFKTLDYKIDDYQKEIKLINVNGVYKRAKYDTLEINSKKIEVFNLLHINDSLFKIVIKDLELRLIDYKVNVKKWDFNYQKIALKGENSEENLTTHLYPNKIYKFEYKFLSDKLGIKIDNKFIAFGYVDNSIILDNVKKDSLKDLKLDLSFLWSQTEYEKAIVGGGSIKLNLKILSQMPTTFNDINLESNINLDEDLFKRITKDFDPAVVNKYFKNYKSHIEIKNGEVIINGNRIQ